MTGVGFPLADGQPETGGRPQVRYVPSSSLWASFEQMVATMIDRSGAVAVGELGGGANPTLALRELVGHPIDLTVLDISAAELARAPEDVDKLCVDLCAEEPPVRERFDLVFSRMLCEHVRSGRIFHRNCHAALRPGGYAVHFFPAVTALPFLLNRALPEALGARLLEAVFPARARHGNHSKFPAHYSWCWGPTAPQLDRYRSVGFDVVSCEVGVGHDYYVKFPGLREAERAKSTLLLRHPTPWLVAYTAVVLRRAR